MNLSQKEPFTESPSHLREQGNAIDRRNSPDVRVIDEVDRVVAGFSVRAKCLLR
jgi:hypothetical protein